MSRITRRAVLVPGVALVAGSAMDSALGADDPASTANAKARLAAADEALKVLEVQTRNGRMLAGDPAYSHWSRRRVEALRDLGDPAALKAGLQDHLAHAKRAEAIAKAQHEAATISTLGVLEAQYNRLEAEAWVQAGKIT